MDSLSKYPQEVVDHIRNLPCGMKLPLRKISISHNCAVQECLCGQSHAVSRRQYNAVLQDAIRAFISKGVIKPSERRELIELFKASEPARDPFERFKELYSGYEIYETLTGFFSYQSQKIEEIACMVPRTTHEEPGTYRYRLKTPSGFLYTDAKTVLQEVKPYTILNKEFAEGLAQVNPGLFVSEHILTLARKHFYTKMKEVFGTNNFSDNVTLGLQQYFPKGKRTAKQNRAPKKDNQAPKASVTQPAPSHAIPVYLMPSDILIEFAECGRKAYYCSMEDAQLNIARHPGSRNIYQCKHCDGYHYATQVTAHPDQSYDAVLERAKKKYVMFPAYANAYILKLYAETT